MSIEFNFDQKIKIPATSAEAKQRNFGKLQEMFGELLKDTPLNSPQHMAFDDYTELQVAEQPLRTEVQEKMIKHIVKQEVIKETIRQRKIDPVYEDAFIEVSGIMEEYWRWVTKQPIPIVDKRWDSHNFTPQWLVEIREQEKAKRRQPTQSTPNK